MRMRPSILARPLAVALAAAAGMAGTSDARTFHVDAAAGDDARDGLTPQTAWRTLAKVNGAALEPGDSVLFCRGGVWRGQMVPRSGASGRPITYGAYGEGAKPALLGSTARNRPEDWQPAGEAVWATVPVRHEPLESVADLGAARWSLHQEGGAACRFDPAATNEAGVVAGRIECGHAGREAHHLQLSMAGFDVKEGECYRFTFRSRCTKPFPSLRVVVMRNGPPYSAYAAAASPPPSIGAVWTDCEVLFRAGQTAAGARLTLYLGGILPDGAVLEFRPGALERVRCSQTAPLDADVGNVIFDDGVATGVKKWSEADLRAEGDFFHDAQTWQVKLRCETNPAVRYRSIELALTRHIVNQGGRSHVSYADLALRYGAAHGIGGGETRGIVVRRCDLAFIGGGLQFRRPDGRPVRFGNGIEFWSGARDCLVEDCRIGEVYDAALTNQGSGTNVQENIVYRGNVIWNCEYSFEYWNRESASLTRNVRFEHNTCVGAGRGWGHRQRPDPNGRHLMFYSNTADTRDFVVRFNIFCDATDSGLRLHGRDWTPALTMDWNCWYQAEGPLALWGDERVEPDRFAAFMAARGFGAHSIVADPMFVALGERDYRLAPDSPARALSDEGRPAGALP